MRFHGLGAQAALFLVGSGALAASGSVQAGKPQSHICPPDAPPPPMAASFDEPAPAAQGVEPAPQPKSTAAPAPVEEPAQFMGCLKRDYALAAAEVAQAQQAVVIADELGSTAAIFRFSSPAQRDALIERWLRRHAPAEFTPDKPTMIYIADWSNASWRLPDRVVVHAMFPQKARSGRVCLVRADTPALRDALPVLNNWCMDVLGLWAD